MVTGFVKKTVLTFLAHSAPQTPQLDLRGGTSQREGGK